MIFRHLLTIVSDHYTSLADETGLVPPFDKVFLLIIYGIAPLAGGLYVGTEVPIWSDFISAGATVLSVLTGFSINTIILLMRYNGDESHPYEQRSVEKTKQFTLYSIFLGVVVLGALVMGLFSTRVDGGVINEYNFIISGIIYSLLIHYFITLLTITHRLWSVVHWDVL